MVQALDAVQPCFAPGCHNLVLHQVVTTLFTSTIQGGRHPGNVSKARLKQGGNKVATIKLVQPSNNLVDSL